MALSLLQVVRDKRQQRRVTVLLELPLNQVRASATVGRHVADAHAPIDPLPIEDPSLPQTL